MRPIENPDVAEVFERYPPRIRRKLLEIRELIFDTAAAREGVGPLEEALRWSEPAYLTSATKSGSTIRLGWKASVPDELALCFHCQTTLVGDFRQWFPDELAFDGNRRIVFSAGQRIPRKPLARCISAALTYHLDRRARRPKTSARGRRV